jgi:hypothetical protein
VGGSSRLKEWEGGCVALCSATMNDCLMFHRNYLVQAVLLLRQVAPLT